jgi:hypothetical protein
MDFLSIFWNDDDDVEGNVQHIAENDLTPDDVNTVLLNPVSKGTSRSSGQPAVFGYTPDGRYIIVIYERIDDDTISPITAYEVDEPI